MSDDADEQFVLVDGAGRPIGTARRADCHADPRLVHLSVHVAVVTPGGPLWQLRGADKDVEPGRWTLACSGHVGAGEEARDAAVRELREEVGIAVAPDDLEQLDEVLLEAPTETEWTILYRLRHAGPFVVAPPEVAGLAIRPPGLRPAPLTASAETLLARLDADRPGWDAIAGHARPGA